MYKYAHCWDNLDFQGWVDCFREEEGVYWEGGGPVLTGYEELLAYAGRKRLRVCSRPLSPAAESVRAGWR